MNREQVRTFERAFADKCVQVTIMGGGTVSGEVDVIDEAGVYITFGVTNHEGPAERRCAYLPWHGVAAVIGEEAL